MMAMIKDRLTSTNAQLIAWIGQLEERDRRAFYALILIFSVCFIYFVLWSPVHAYKASALMERDRQFEIIQWMRSTEAQIRQSDKRSVGMLSGQNLLTEISSQARRYGVVPSRLQPESNEGISVWFDDVSFNDLIKWLQKLDRDGQIVIRQITIDAASESGKVNARLVLSS